MDTLLYRSTRSVLIATSLIQLALSQIHIELITKLFISDIGFYLFLFVIFGLLILFNLSSMKDSASGRLGTYIIMTIATLASGSVYVYKVWSDYLAQESVTLPDIRLSLIISVTCMIIYLIGGLIVSAKCIAHKEK